MTDARMYLSLSAALVQRAALLLPLKKVDLLDSKLMEVEARLSKPGN